MKFFTKIEFQGKSYYSISCFPTQPDAVANGNSIIKQQDIQRGSSQKRYGNGLPSVSGVNVRPPGALPVSDFAIHYRNAR